MNGVPITAEDRGDVAMGSSMSIIGTTTLCGVELSSSNGCLAVCRNTLEGLVEAAIGGLLLLLLVDILAAIRHCYSTNIITLFTTQQIESRLVIIERTN
jgi:hypothetical protein